MRRRKFLGLLGVASLIWPLSASAQPQYTVRRVGLILGFPKNDPLLPDDIAAFRDGLREAGLDPERDLHIDERWPGIDPDRTRKDVRELISLRPDLIVGSTNQVVTILMQETQSIPIVFVYIGDPLGSGYAQTLARPGKNLTGFANFEAPIGGKWLELLKELAPIIRRIGFIYHPAASPHREFLDVAQKTAPGLGLELSPLPVSSVAEIEESMVKFAKSEIASGIVVAPHALTLGASGLIADLALRHRLPGVYGDRIFAQRGGLMSFGIYPPDQLRRAAGYVNRILKGEQPGNLPVQLPVKYEMIINTKTAAALGLNIPPAMLARADSLIE